MTMLERPGGVTQSVTPPAGAQLPQDPATPVELPSGVPDQMLLTQLANQIYGEQSSGDMGGVGNHSDAALSSPALAIAGKQERGAGPAQEMTAYQLHRDGGGIAGHPSRSLSQISALDSESENIPELPATGRHEAHAPQGDAPAVAPRMPTASPAIAPNTQALGQQQPAGFALPAAVNQRPEPPELFVKSGLPESPRDPPVPASVLQPYWLGGKGLGLAPERNIEITNFAPVDIDLLPTQIFTNVPDKPPEKPPSKAFFQNKVIAMSGQDVSVNSGAPDHLLPAANPGAAGVPGGHSSGGNVPAGLPHHDSAPGLGSVSRENSHAHPVAFTLPAEVNQLPEPPELFTALGLPESPRDPPVPTSVLQPYWLEGKGIGATLERDIEIASEVANYAPADIDLLPTQVFTNVPDKPPEKPPEKPPSKAFFQNKVIAMSGQDVSVNTGTPNTAPPSAGSLPVAPELPSAKHYWLPKAPADLKVVEPGHGQKKPAAPLLGSTDGFNVQAVRKDFPILRQRVNGKPLVWLDNAATTQKPQAVIDRMAKFYEEENSNVHRGAHEMAARATDAYEAARDKVARFLGASTTEEIIFTRGTTESINLVAQTYGKQHLGKGDEIILIEYEHHSNIVPWQMVTKETGASIRVAPILDTGEIDLAAYEKMFSRHTRMVAIGHVSNALGTVAPLREMVATAHRHGAVVLVDGAQSVPHFPVNVQEIGADFLAMSGHKLFGPTGVGVLWGRKELLNEMPPWQGGGNMIKDVTFKHTTYNEAPSKFEAGTGILASAVGLGAAIDYLERIGFANAARYEEELLHYGQEQISAIRGVRMIGTAKTKAGVMSFVTDKITPDEFGVILNKEGIAVRVGHHCAQPALAHFGLKQTVRPSIAFYNTREEIDLLVRVIDRALRSR